MSNPLQNKRPKTVNAKTGETPDAHPSALGNNVKRVKQKTNGNGKPSVSPKQVYTP